MEERGAITWRDAWLPGALLVVGAFEMTKLALPHWGGGIVMEGIASVLLVWRRRNALLFATTAMVAILAIPVIGPPMDQPAVPIAYFAVSLYALARWHADYRGLIGMAVVLGATLSDYVFVDTRAHNVSDVFFVLTIAVPPYVVGRIARQLSDRAELVERNQELVRREAVRAERDRIARELHDVVAHSVSAMVVQTAAAQDLVRTDPERAESVLEDVAATGRRALVETGRLLHVIRDEHDELGLGPTPGLREVPGLVEAFRESGLAVDFRADEPLPELSPGLDVSAYRIVQEALTNAHKHGADRTAAVRVSTTPTTLEIDATNPANGRQPSAPEGSGLGLVGMAERVSLLGGRLTHGTEGGLFRVSVTVPLAPSGAQA